MALLSWGDAPDQSCNAALGGRGFDGDDPVVVLVHGAGMDRTVWQMQTRWLAHHGYRVAAIDLPGHGKSPGEPLPSVEAYATWLGSAIAGLGVGPVHLAGHSLGSFIALDLAADQPELVKTVSLYGTAQGMPVHPTLLEAAENLDPLAWQLMSGWAFGPRSKVGVHPSPGGNMVGTTQALLGRAGPGVLANDLRASGGYERALDQAANCSVPATLVLGRDDRMTPLKSAQPLIEAFSAPTVEIVDCGHMMTVEAPDDVRQIMARTFAES